MRMQRSLMGMMVLNWFVMAALCQAEPPTEDDYYPISRCEMPEEAVLEPGGFQLMPDGRLAIGTRRGEIWMVSDPFANEIKASQYSLFAHGLHEVLSLAERDGWLYAVERGDVIRMKDTNGNGTADLFEIVNDGWEICGDQHEYAFGSKFDKQGDLWITLCLTGSSRSDVPYRGWCVRVTPKGEMIPTTSGIRSPGGVGINALGDVFYTDNQGPWNGTCSLRPLRPGKFVGHPAGNKWYELPAVQASMGPAPPEPQSGSRLIVEGDKISQLDQPAILFPYKKMGQSASGVTCDTSAGKFGPFENQMFVGDQTYSTVMRCDLEQVNGVYQGACFPFREGFGSGIVGLEMTPQGAMFAGGTARGWGARGTKEFSVERVSWTGKAPFEIRTMRLEPDGFTLTFTLPVDAKTAADPASYTMQTYCYIYQASYGSPEVDHTTPKIESITVGADGKSVKLKLAGLVRGHVHELHAEGVRSREGLPLLHKDAYYTLNELKK